jgi:exosome complex component RRP41
MDGMLSSEEFEEALKLAIEGCRQIHTMQREALRQKYSAVREVAEEEAVESEAEKKEEA